ncbi:Acetylglutamate kinase [Candidatus Terasakiella magnetica]|uniref:Acetylglutamate kinase n=1 Tax=Candidatus Terasakiella magnetica TaxID=1867952 RepID=A0A1C3RH54_9PROT|nr:acetylglutamate kinase [Candidatus Terasakiella magnetica]SCA56514.1 Acetylglutamate kinase [Candidatus Terasakiella magnetica]
MTTLDKSPMTEEDYLSQAVTLSEALPYMQRYAGETVVIKYGGHAMGDPELAKLFAKDIVLLKQVGINPVVVHGGGPQIGNMLKRLEVETNFIDGLRVTDQATIDVAEMVLSGSINKSIVANINAAGGFAVGLSGKDGSLIRAKKLHRTKKDPESNIEKVLDLGFVGEPEFVTPHILDTFLESDIIPVVAPIGMGANGETFNINADTAAGAIAAAIDAKRLLMLTDIAGVMDGDKNLIQEMNAVEARAMIADGTISGGMIPKIETCLGAVEQTEETPGVNAAVIMDGRVPHAVLLEIFTEHGAGTMIRGLNA